jgi:3-phenylpropionate/cinnamic acid dioxygenase small subunit
MEAADGAMTREEAEAFIFREVRLLDSLELEEWLTLFTDDGVYWLPVHDGEPDDAADAVSIVFDDRARREERVFRTLHTPVLDQSPRSRTVHLVGNVEVVGKDERGDVRVLCSQFISELRPGGVRQVGLNQSRVLAARAEYRLRPTEDGPRMSLKKLLLVDADQPLYNLTFVI